MKNKYIIDSDVEIFGVGFSIALAGVAYMLSNSFHITLEVFLACIFFVWFLKSLIERKLKKHFKEEDGRESEKVPDEK